MESHPIVGSHSGALRLEAATMPNLTVSLHDLFSWAPIRGIASARDAIDG